ncbi:hypothetical protein ACA29_18775 [Lederbergia galactosidilytica]|uniref:Uncharacterized protein n=1 Tax=Lederbergia galactosidilytica TaxID=217031 RepID=A0A0Q9Y0X5_9BACI|nr:hypothetical protein ACA29_18775 [Lederbergia galactosidilytica]
MRTEKGTFIFIFQAYDIETTRATYTHVINKKMPPKKSRDFMETFSKKLRFELNVIFLGYFHHTHIKQLINLVNTTFIGR